MNSMDDYEIIDRMLNASCYEGNRHNCIRDASRLVGGFLAAGRLTVSEGDSLKSLAMRLSGGAREFGREWEKGVEFGRGQPAARVAGADDSQPDRPLDWDSPLALAGMGASRLAGGEWQAPETLEPPPPDMDGAAALAEYLRGLFRPGEHVGFVTAAADRDGKWTPADRGVAYMTAGEMLAKLKRKDGLRECIGDYNPEAGAWIRFNPLDGEGVADANVTDFRFALVECDEDSVEKQVALIKSLNLPCKFIVHSGGHSAHAIVHIDAGDDPVEYRRRVEFLYKTCRDHGLKADKTGNPSRLSRLPGATRGGRPQYIIARDTGPASWPEWVDFLEKQADDLPAFGNAADMAARAADGRLPLRPPLIDGILRTGHKMRLAGPSKAGKSFALLELAVCLTEGRPWLGLFPCPNPGNVLYVNLELDEASCAHRLAAIYKAMGIARPQHAQNLFVWQLRGHATGLDKLAPVVIRRCRDMHLAAIIVDPIYKVLTGDENAAADMARFCNHFDRIAMECGCAVIDCHHHSKGAQGGKKSMDRASGSGVFARDPDALLDMIELDSAKARDQALRNAEQDALWKLGSARAPDALRALAPDAGPDDIFHELDAAGLGDAARAARLAARARWERATGWRIEPTLREFPAFDAVDVWFQYPVHSADSGLLADCEPLDAEAAYGRRRPAGEKKPDAGAIVENVIDELFQDPARQTVAVREVAEEVGRRCKRGSCSNFTVKDGVRASQKYHLKKDLIYRGGNQ